MKSGIPSPGHLKSKTVQSASIMRMSEYTYVLIPGAATRLGERLKNDA